MRNVSVTILAFLFMGFNLFAQGLIQPNLASYTTLVQEGDIILNTALTLTKSGLNTDLALYYSPLKPVGLGIYTRINDGVSQSIGGTFGLNNLDFHNYEFEIYTGLDHVKTNGLTYSLYHDRYYAHLGLSRRYKRVSHGLFARINMIDFTRLNIKRLDHEVIEIQKEIENDPIVFPEINYKIAYGSQRVQGYIMLNKTILRNDLWIHQNAMVALGFQLNITMVAEHLFSYHKTSN